MPRKKIEPDSVFFLKVLFYFLIGTFWIRISNDGINDTSFSIPAGLFLGIFFAHHDHFKIDRKIEFAILIISTILSYYVPIGLVL